MSAPDATCIQFNFKLHNGDLINIYAESIDEAAALLDEVHARIVEPYYAVANAFRAANAVASTPTPAPAPPTALPGASPALPGATPTPAATSAPLCEHGQPAKLVPGGVSKKTNRPYPAFYACAQPQALQCRYRETVDAA